MVLGTPYACRRRNGEAVDDSFNNIGFSPRTDRWKTATIRPFRKAKGTRTSVAHSQGMPDRRLNPLQFPLGHQGGVFCNGLRR